MEEFNRAPQEKDYTSDISETSSFDDLRQLISSSEMTLAGSRENDSDNLVNLISEVEAGNITLDYITRTGGLREQVAKLSIAKSKSFEELSICLENIKELTSESGSYSREELIARVQKAIDGGGSIVVPRVFELRATVARLISEQEETT